MKEHVVPVIRVDKAKEAKDAAAAAWTAAWLAQARAKQAHDLEIASEINRRREVAAERSQAGIDRFWSAWGTFLAVCMALGVLVVVLSAATGVLS